MIRPDEYKMHLIFFPKKLIISRKKSNQTVRTENFELVGLDPAGRTLKKIRASIEVSEMHKVSSSTHFEALKL